MINKIKVKVNHYPEVHADVDEDVIHAWVPHGFRIKLIIDDKGYLTDHPRFLDDTVVPAQGLHAPSDGSLIGYRVRLRTPEDDPPTPTDPTGCRLINGKWY